jgi:hypothetical protein
MTKETSLPLTARYAAAVREFRASYAALAAADQRAGRTGFGPPIDVIHLRHAIANPDESGSLHDDIAAAR